MQKIRHLSEAAALLVLFAVFRLLPLDAASFIGGWLARKIGPFLSAHKTAQRNLAMVFADMPVTEQRALLARMWDNLGRNAAELPHLPGDTLYNRMTISGLETLPPREQPVVFWSGHFGNWELTYPIAPRHNRRVTLIYRRANNPYADAIISGIRKTQADDMLAKGKTGAVKLGRAIKDGNSLAMLVDQKMNEGIAVPFFGRDAMTAPAIAEFALRYGMPLIPARCVRTHGCHFAATIYPPLQFEKTGDKEKDIRTILTHINAMLESWIRECPEQWFWVHKRWPKDEDSISR